MARIAKLIKTRIKKPYVQKTMLITKSNIKKLLRPAWHREFRNAHVRVIKHAMMHGEHPSENITVNQIGMSYRIINGNHRTQAIRDIIENFPKFSIELTLTIYSDLTKEEELEIYSKVNNTRRESGMDRLKAHLHGTDIDEMLQNKFPFRVIYRNIGRDERNVITASTVMASYVYRNQKSIACGIRYIIGLAKTLEQKDFNRMIRFANFFKRVFGEPSKENIFSSYNLYSVFGKLFYTLVGTDLTEEEYEKKCRKIIARNLSELLMYNRGINMQKSLYLFLIEKLQTGTRKKLFNVYEH